jgi:hypothetical protein
VKIRLPIAVLTALAAAALFLATSGTPAKAVTTTHFLLFNVGLQKCATQTGTEDVLYLTACPDATSKTINHSLLWSQNGYGEIVNMHSDDCMIVTGNSPGTEVWLTGPTSAGSGYCNPVTVDEWSSGYEGQDNEFENGHSHLYITGDPNDGALDQDILGSVGNQIWHEVPTNSAS